MKCIKQTRSTGIFSQLPGGICGRNSSARSTRVSSTKHSQRPKTFDSVPSVGRSLWGWDGLEKTHEIQRFDTLW